MQLESSIVVKKSLEEVIEFFYHPDSLARWDRSVSEMRPKPDITSNSIASFETISPSGMKMTYDVIEMEPAGRSVKILLVNSKMFKKAVWHFEFAETLYGTKVTCQIDFRLRLKYCFLYPILFFNKSALLRDLNVFETELEKFANEKNASRTKR